MCEILACVRDFDILRIYMGCTSRVLKKTKKRYWNFENDLMVKVFIGICATFQLKYLGQTR